VRIEGFQFERRHFNDRRQTENLNVNLNPFNLPVSMNGLNYWGEAQLAAAGKTIWTR